MDRHRMPTSARVLQSSKLMDRLQWSRPGRISCALSRSPLVSTLFPQVLFNMTIGIRVIDTIADCLGNQDQLSLLPTPGTALDLGHLNGSESHGHARPYGFDVPFYSYSLAIRSTPDG